MCVCAERDTMDDSLVNVSYICTDKSEFIRANQTLIISLFIYENMIFHYIRKN